MTIRTRLYVGLGITLGMIVLFGATFHYAQRKYNHLQVQLKTTRNELKAWLVVDNDTSHMLKELLESLSEPGSAKSRANHELITDLHSGVAEESLALLNEVLTRESNAGGEKSKEFDRLRQSTRLFVQLKEDVIHTWKLHLDHRTSEAIAYFKAHIDTPGTDDQLHAFVAAGVKREDEDVADIEAELAKLNVQLRIALLVLFGTCLVVTLFAVVRINQSVLRSIQHAKSALIQGISELRVGKEDAIVNLEDRDELSAIGAAFNVMARELQSSRKVILEQQQKLINTSKMSALGEMAAGVAHEINNPLAVISAVAEHLEDVVQDEVIDKDSMVRLAGQIRATIERIAKIVSGLRSFARDGSHDPMARVNIVGVIKGTFNFCQERFRQHGVELLLEGTDADIQAVCRSTQIEQVVLNLLNNAHDAVVDSAEKWVKISLRDGGNFLEIEITDSGKGIPQEVADKIFQPFFTTKEIGKGTGIGLSISNGIIAGHGGTIRLDRTCPNTRFLVRLPKNENDGGMISPSKKAA